MKIKTATFIVSNTDVRQCPAPDKPEYAFIGRSNVGKSSLINRLCNHKNLAKTSGTPGKTQLINHFLINQSWYLVDLPGYGYAKIARSERKKWKKFVERYLLHRTNLLNLFVLVDSRHPPQKIDMEFMQWLGANSFPFSLVFTKTDKLKAAERATFLPRYEREMLRVWEEMPPVFTTSAVSSEGKEELLSYIGTINSSFQPNGTSSFLSGGSGV